MHRNIPEPIWNFWLVHVGELLTRMVRRYYHRSGYQVVLWETPDISEWIGFGFYDFMITYGFYTLLRIICET